MGALISEEFVDKAVAAKRLSEHLMMVKLVIKQCLIDVILGYIPQVGECQLEMDTLSGMPNMTW